MSLRFDVEPDEHILKTALARSFQPPSHQRKAKFKAYFFAEGRLYLTNLRLVWRRSWFNVPFVPVHSFEIPLEEIQSCSVRGTGFAMAFGGGGLFVATDGGEHRLLLAINRLWPPALWYSKKTAEDWHHLINKMIVSR